jgi:hypothetical protein
LTVPAVRLSDFYVEKGLAARSAQGRPQLVASQEPLGPSPWVIYDVDFDDFFVEQLLDEVVAGVDQTVTIAGREIEGA